jgi:subtilisin inhibitor-like
MNMRCAVAALVALILTPAGCTFPGQDATQGPTALTVRITALVAGGQKTILVRTLRCDPPAGTVPHPAAACAALRDYRARFRPITSSCGCGAQMYGKRSAVVSGRLDGRPFHAELGGCTCGYTGEEVRDLRIGTGLRRITPPFGTITGRVMSVGGPYPGTKRPMANEQIIVTGHDADRIRLRTGVRSGSSGRFRISLPAGRYTVRTPGGGPHHSVRVQVTPDGLVHVRLVRDIY